MKKWETHDKMLEKLKDIYPTYLAGSQSMCPSRVANRTVAMSLAFPAVMDHVHVHVPNDADAVHHSCVHAAPNRMISSNQPLGLLLSGEPVWRIYTILKWTEWKEFNENVTIWKKCAKRFFFLLKSFVSNRNVLNFEKWKMQPIHWTWLSNEQIRNESRWTAFFPSFWHAMTRFV